MDYSIWLWVALGIFASFALGVIYGMHVCEQHQKEMFRTWRDAHERD